MTDVTEQQFIQRLRDAVVKSNERELADRLRVSRPTLRRWLNGTVLPHPAVRPSILRALANL